MVWGEIARFCGKKKNPRFPIGWKPRYAVPSFCFRLYLCGLVWNWIQNKTEIHIILRIVDGSMKKACIHYICWLLCIYSVSLCSKKHRVLLSIIYSLLSDKFESSRSNILPHVRFVCSPFKVLCIKMINLTFRQVSKITH